ncbi:MAG TPA: 6-phosphogluconolactonase [Actinomycetota bacterium]|nr:6-phosphogluconolactonase [Actinomycetota bacterium]
MIRVETLPDPEAACARAAALIAQILRAAIAEHGRATWAISGGEGPAPMFRRLAELDLPWGSVDTWQVDERIAPAGDPDRNRSLQTEALPAAALPGVRWMPVEAEDAGGSADRYAEGLPDRFDVVHLGLGPDGHTASLVPDDAVLEVDDRDVAVTGRYQRRRRMTLTYRGLSRARSAVWLVTGAAKRGAVRSLVAGDRTIPGARVPIAAQVLIADRAAGAD